MGDEGEAKKTTGTRYLVFEDHGADGLKLVDSVVASGPETAVRVVTGGGTPAMTTYAVVPETNFTPINLEVVRPEPRVTVTKVDAGKWIAEKRNLADQRGEATVTALPSQSASTGGDLT